MKFKYSNVLLALMLIAFISLSTSCRNDDDGLQSIPERDRTEQQAADEDTLSAYFNTHYYNSDELAALANPGVEDIIITKLGEGETVPDAHTLLADVVETHTTEFLGVDYEFYVLRIRQGGGEKQPEFCDFVRTQYQGSLLDGSVFDSSANSVVFDLTNLVSGWSRVMPLFNTAEDFVLNNDGTVSFNNAGVGVMFLPSGLGFYSGSAVGIPVYSNLVFKFELFQTETNDHDGDGVPSWYEDEDDNLSLTNDDNDGDLIADFIDTDDDNDGIPTINELIHNTYSWNPGMGEEPPVLAELEFERDRTVNDGVITIATVTIVDSNNDGLEDYLDENIAVNNNQDD